ncbi:MAG: hypothetical protein U9N49_04660 [Campylobacterota bacterium]|nr:hypothetical protein [Campylobacterota bacterium]
MQMQQNEPTLEELEDYNGEESREKKFVIWGVVIIGLLLGGLYSYFRTAYTNVEDQIVTKPYIMDMEKK